MRKLFCTAAGGLAWLCAAINSSHAAVGEMGTGVPSSFGTYGAATGSRTVVWQLVDLTIPLASGCPHLHIYPGTMGADAYKVAVATLMLAKVSNRSVRFVAHSERDGGCGVDYIELL